MNKVIRVINAFEEWDEETQDKAVDALLKVLMKIKKTTTTNDSDCLSNEAQFKEQVTNI